MIEDVNARERPGVKSFSHLSSLDAERYKSKNIRRGVIIILLSGSAKDFSTKVIYQLISAAITVNSSRSEFILITAYILEVLSYLACALPPMFSSEARECVKRFMTRRFLIKVTAPSFLDLIVKGARFAAIVFISPAVVAMIKISVQLVTVTLLSRFIRQKEYSKRKWIAILGVLVGNGLVFAVTILIKASSDNTENGDYWLGLVLAVFSGVVGGTRNIIEEVLLQDYGMTDSSLLLVESALSFFLAVIVGALLLMIVDPAISRYWKTWTSTGVIPTVFLFVIFSYGRDLGKLKLTKYSSAVTAKVIAVLFPFGTWALSLLIYYLVSEGKEHPVGDRWYNPWSFLRLAGFILIVVSVYFFQSAAQVRYYNPLEVTKSFRVNDDVRGKFLVSSNGTPALEYIRDNDL